MLLFLLGIVVLIVGYFTYGKFVSKILAPDNRATPANRKADGVDFIVLPHWKNMLIHLLNIAGIGPVIGVIIGIKFGTVVFIIIPIANILAGAVHDFISGMMSLRSDGANLPELVRLNLGKKVYSIFSIFVVACLLLVVAVFVNIPTSLIVNVIDNSQMFWLVAGGILVYYIVATLFPIDKIIGTFYPIFGAVLLLSTLALFFCLVIEGFKTPDLLIESESFLSIKSKQPIIPMLFVTIACGIISGFHSTQAPIIARTIGSEHQARAAFYGMMIVEGIIAMIWAAAALAVYNTLPQTLTLGAPAVLNVITKHFLGNSLGMFTVVGVIILAITSGDTAMRSIRISLAEIFNINQKKIKMRLLLSLFPLLIVLGLLYWSSIHKESFDRLWNYFSWSNQVVASVALMAGTSWLARQRKNYWIALIPAIFMTFIVLVYILWISPQHGGPVGIGLNLHLSYVIAAVIACFLAIVAVKFGKKKQI